MSSSLELTEIQIDALKEVANIGAGHAATALSQLLNTTITLQAPKAEIIRFKDLASRVGEERTIAALHVYVRGELPGQMLVMFDYEDALKFVRIFVRRVVGDIQIFDSIVDSTLKELGNLIAGSYLGAIVQLTGANMVPSVPTLSYGTIPAAFRSLMSTVPEQDVFLVESTFLDRGVRVSGNFILIPETGSLAPLLAVFGVE